MTDQQRPIIIGHRGAAGEAPENTLASFQLALEQGAEAVELDVHETADGELVVCHDDTIDRTTNGSGAIHRLTVEELQRYDAGMWFHESYAGERVPTLEQVFQLLPKHIMINVEVKCSYSPRLAKRLVELLEQYGRLQQDVISSFSHKVLHQLKQDEPRLKVGLLYTADLVRHRSLAETAGFEVYSLHPYHLLCQPEDVADLTEHGLCTYPYTANKEEHLHRLIQAGVTGIITDFPGRLKKLLEQRG
jgi:glycerophosphoryl diester phosphodiesterase